MIPRVNQANPILNLAGNQIVPDDVLEEVDLCFQELLLACLHGNDFLDVKDENRPEMAVSPTDIE